MEEHVGQYWHRFLRRVTRTGYPEHAVTLDELRPSLRVYFRALGGEIGLRVEPGQATVWPTRRGWLARIGDTQRYTDLAWCDERAMYLPPQLDLLPSASLNRELYFWLAALAAQPRPAPGKDWIERSDLHTRAVLERYAGLRPRYQRLMQAHLAQRTPLAQLKDEDAQIEARIVAALKLEATQSANCEMPRVLPQPVPLWLHPFAPSSAVPARRTADQGGDHRRGKTKAVDDLARKRAQRVKPPTPGRGLITIRMENILTWGEFVNVDRDVDENDDLDEAESAARDIDKLAISDQRSATGGRLKFDLELPAEQSDDQVLSDGLRLPEWDWRQQRLLPERCRVVELIDDRAAPTALHASLVPLVGSMCRRLEAFRLARRRHRAQPEGDELDLDQCLDLAAAVRAQRPTCVDRLYARIDRDARDLACLVLADLSQSTDAYVNNDARVIDVIRDSLLVFSEALESLGDDYAILGFSSRRNDPIRIHQIKRFEAPLDDAARGRIAAIRPGFYTRMGAAIRFATRTLNEQSQEHKILLVITDGKPNDLDQYEGRYGIEDTRHAILAAQRNGLSPFCVTIDDRGHDYLPHLFGPGGYVVIQRPAQLPERLPRLYARLIANA